MFHPSETVVVSVGGSLIVPDHIDTHFLSSLKDLVETETAQGRPIQDSVRDGKTDQSVSAPQGTGRRFVLIAGGGKTARRYQDAAREIGSIEVDDIDWLGIHSTHLNGHLLRTIFREIAYPVMIKNPDDVLDVPDTYHVVIAAGYRPGASTDLRAIQIAERVGAKKVVNLSNTDYVYTDNPNTNPDAQKIEEITWSEFRKLIPDEWDPGLSSPFDPVAAKEAQRLTIEVASINGTKLVSLKNYLDGKPFTGTRIHSE